jgi:hypothetical protein
MKETLQRCVPITNPPLRDDQFDVLLGSPELIAPGHWCQVEICLKRMSSDLISFDPINVVSYQETYSLYWISH